VTARVVLIGYGNPSRGDDALGPALLACAQVWLAEHPAVDVRLVEDFQLQVEHGLDVAESDLALFIDADVLGPAPFSLRRVFAARDSTYSTHELSPEAVLHVAQQVTGRAAPPAWLFGVRGVKFVLGETLSAAAAGHLEAAWVELQQLLADPRPEAWDARTTRRSARE